MVLSSNAVAGQLVDGQQEDGPPIYSIPLHDIHADIKSIEADLSVAKSMTIQRKAFVFDPAVEEEMLDSHDLADYRIGDEALSAIITRVWEVRERLAPPSEDEQVSLACQQHLERRSMYLDGMDKEEIARQAIFPLQRHDADPRLQQDDFFEAIDKHFPSKMSALSPLSDKGPNQKAGPSSNGNVQPSKAEDDVDEEECDDDGNNLLRVDHEENAVMEKGIYHQDDTFSEDEPVGDDPVAVPPPMEEEFRGMASLQALENGHEKDILDSDSSLLQMDSLLHGKIVHLDRQSESGSRIFAMVMADDGVNEAARIVASFRKGKKLTVEQKIYLTKQKIERGRSTNELHYETGVSKVAIDRMAKAVENNPSWLAEMKQQMEK